MKVDESELKCRSREYHPSYCYQLHPIAICKIHGVENRKDEKYEVCVRSADIALSAPVAPSNTLVSLWDFVPMILQLNNIGLGQDGHVVSRLHLTFKLDSFGRVAEGERPTQEGRRFNTG